MPDNLRVQKTGEPVSLFMTDGIVFAGHVYLAQYALLHTGEQTLLDLLLEEDLFLPMHNSKGEFRLVQKGMICYLRCQVHLLAGIEYTEQQVEISFPGNTTLRGIIKINMPDHSIRLTDYINAGDNFFPLFFGEVTYLVNRNLIREIVPLDD